MKFRIPGLVILATLAACPGNSPTVLVPPEGQQPQPTPVPNDPYDSNTAPPPSSGAPGGVGQQQPATDCGSDACFRRELDANGACTVVERFGRPVYELFDGGWGYDYNQAAGATLAFRVLAEDHPLHLLHAPGIGVKMLTVDRTEATYCGWCGCATDCAFRETGIVISTASQPLDGMVKLVRYCDGSVDQRDSVTPIHGWNVTEGQDHGYVCPPEPL